jgi:periplasmic protein TonB
MKKNTFSAFLGISFLVHAALVLWLVPAAPPPSIRGLSVMEVSLVSLAGPRAEPRSPGTVAKNPGVAAMQGPSRGSDLSQSRTPREADQAFGDLETPAPAMDGGGTPGAQASGDGDSAPSPARQSQGGTAASVTSYNRLIVDIISRNRHYPDSARRRGIEGTVDVRLTIDRTGHASDVRVVKTSGAGILDRASVRTIQGCSFPPPPLDSVTLPITITFRLVDESRS